MSARAPSRTTAAAGPSLLRWIGMLGGLGFAAGFFGPMLLNPGANQGPMAGLFITGPGGAVAGAILGLVFRVLPVSAAARTRALHACTAVLVLGTLWACLPEPEVLGYVVDASVTDCARPADSSQEALARWQAAAARAAHVTLPPDWQQRAVDNLQRDPGAVLTLDVARRAPILEHRKPWNAGRRELGAWSPGNASQRYYANDDGADCRAYLARLRQLYLPFDATARRAPGATPVWPPVDTTGFLSLLTLGPPPDDYRRLLAGR
jgi:hypothetical protein